MNAITDLKQEFAPAMRVLPKLLEARAAQFGDAPLFSCGDLHLSYRDMQQAAARVAGALMGAGIATGDRVAILCSNRAEFMPLFLGCGWMGAVSAPISKAHGKLFWFTPSPGAFDDWRAKELERIEEERRKLDEMREQFDDYLRELRRAKDQEEFDRFMAERKASGKKSKRGGSVPDISKDD